MIPEVRNRKYHICKESHCFHELVQLKKSESVWNYFPHSIYLFISLFKLILIFIAKCLEKYRKAYTESDIPTTQRQLKIFPWDTVLKLCLCCENYVYFLNFLCILTNFPSENLYQLKAPQCVNIPIFPFHKHSCFKIFTH